MRIEIVKRIRQLKQETYLFGINKKGYLYKIMINHIVFL